MLKAAIIGCGDIAGGYDMCSSPSNILTHAGAYWACPEVRLVAAADPDPERLKSFLAHWAVGHGFATAAEMLAAVKPEIVSICSPTPFHAAHVETAVHNGVRAVICEKPLATDASQARRVTELCREHGVVLCVPYLRRWAPHFIGLGQQLSSGNFGAARAVTVFYTKGVRHNGSHFMDLLCAWFGDWGNVRTIAAEPWGQYDVAADFGATFGNVRAVFQHFSHDCYEVAEMHLFCENARIEVVRGGKEIRVHTTLPHPVLKDARTLAPSPLITAHGEDRNMLHMLCNVVDALCGEKPLAAVPEDAVRVLQLCDTISGQAGTLMEVQHG